MKRKDIEKKVEGFLKKGDFETAAFYAEHLGDLGLAISYLERGKNFENKNKREIFYQDPIVTKEILKDLIYFNKYNPNEIPENFYHENFSFLERTEFNLKKN